MESLPLGGTTSPPTLAYWRSLLVPPHRWRSITVLTSENASLAKFSQHTFWALDR
jgi:hypothetical protein